MTERERMPATWLNKKILKQDGSVQGQSGSQDQGHKVVNIDII